LALAHKGEGLVQTLFSESKELGIALVVIFCGEDGLGNSILILIIIVF
jgi:hypothetical protein